MAAFYQSEQFERFVMERMNGSEFAHFRVRAGLLALHPSMHASFHEDFCGERGKRELRVSYYYSTVLNQLFVLGAHLLRKGEPTEWDREQMDAYLESIREWERDSSRRPDAFPVIREEK